MHAGGPVPHRFASRHHGARFWIAMWALAVAAEFGALVPILFGDDPVAGADVVYRLVGGSFRGVRPDRLAAAAGQPQRPADDRDGLRPVRRAAR